MATDDKAGKWRKVIVIIVVVLLTLMLLIGLLVGLSSLRKFFTWLLVGLLILAIIFGLMYVFWLIFLKKSYKDIPASYRKKLMHTAKLMRNDMLGDLYLTGDSKHNKIKLGKFGYLRMRLPKQTSEYIETKQKGEFGEFSKQKEVTTTRPIEIDCFIVFKNKLLDKLFSEPLFIMVKPEDHNHSTVFNDVYVNGFNLVPLDSNFYTINTRNLDVDIIKGMSIVYEKEVVDEIFKNLDRLVKMSIKLDQDHQKGKEKMLQFDIPQVNTGDNQ